MADSKQDEGFKVVDRRLFTEAGELRKDAADQDRRWEEESAKKNIATPTARGLTPPAAIPPPEQLQTAGLSAAADGSAGGPAIAASRSFQMLVDFLTRNAAAMLGGMADPRTGQAFFDLEGAREIIDMLDVLREKTKGNLAKGDEDLLIEVLGSLKLTFMEISKVAAEQTQKKAGTKK